MKSNTQSNYSAGIHIYIANKVRFGMLWKKHKFSRQKSITESDFAWIFARNYEVLNSYHSKIKICDEISTTLENMRGCGGFLLQKQWGKQMVYIQTYFRIKHWQTVVLIVYSYYTKLWSINTEEIEILAEQSVIREDRHNR